VQRKDDRRISSLMGLAGYFAPIRMIERKMKMQKQDIAQWSCRFRLTKYWQDIEKYRGREAEFYGLFKPYEVISGEGNCLLNSGIDELWDLVCGDSANHFNNAGAQIGVGDSSTAASATQTDLQAATNKTYKGMDTGYPTSTTQKATFKASFGASDANYTWNEWVVKQSTSGKCLNRKVDSLGTKTGGTWTLQVDITLA
jgi:hypothetical protein